MSLLDILIPQFVPNIEGARKVSFSSPQEVKEDATPAQEIKRQLENERLREKRREKAAKKSVDDALKADKRRVQAWRKRVSAARNTVRRCKFFLEEAEREYIAVINENPAEKKND